MTFPSPDSSPSQSAGPTATALNPRQPQRGLTTQQFAARPIDDFSHGMLDILAVLLSEDVVGTQGHVIEPAHDAGHAEHMRSHEEVLVVEGDVGPPVQGDPDVE